MELQRLRAEHADAVLEFETRNRAFFAAWIPDRGDDFFAGYPGRGVATRAVAQVCHLARTEYGLTRLRATVTTGNPASRAVLLRNGFTLVGDTEVNDRPAELFRLTIACSSAG